MQIARHHRLSSSGFEDPMNAAGPWPRAAANTRLADFPLSRGIRRRIVTAQKGEYIFSQGEDANAAFYLQEGEVKMTVLSRGGREATIGLLSANDFIGEECVMEIQPRRMASAVAFTSCTLVRIERAEMIRALHEGAIFAAVFVSFLLAQTARMQDSLLDQIFNCSEKRLARVLLQMARSGEGGPREAIVPKVSQEMLAKMVGTTRSRVSYFMNRFRRLGYIDYNGSLSGGLRIRGSLRNVVLSSRGFSTKPGLFGRDQAA
jgi:CRP/FNR family cyclic AMP-dependent transcriptional regulator